MEVARHARDLVHLGRTISSKLGELHLMAFSSALAFGAVFALVPMLALLALLLGLFNAQQLVTRAIDEAVGVLPDDVVALLEQQLQALAGGQDQGRFGLGVAASAGIALWGASGAMRRVMEALDVVNGVQQRRGMVVRYGISVLLAVGAIVLMAVSITVIAVGGGVATKVFAILGWSGAADVWQLLRWPLLSALAWLGIATLYRFAPSRAPAHGVVTVGTFVATAGWVGFSLAYSWYLGAISDLGATWGSVAGIIALMLYVQYAGLIVLLGALLDDMRASPRR